MIRNNILILTAAILWHYTNAQDTIPTRELREFVVTATRSEIYEEDVPRSLTVISSKEIESSGFQKLGELLSVQQGITMIGSRGTPGSTQTVFMRGESGNHTVIMIDGIPVTDPSSVNRSLDLSELSLSGIDHIEIVRGTQSTLYGSSAIGGVINIFTKGKQSNGFHVNTELEGASFGESGLEGNSDIHLNYSFEKGLFFNADVNNSVVNGIDATVDTVTDENVYNVRDNDNFSKMDISGNFGYKNDKIDAMVSYKAVHQKADIDKGAFRDDDNYFVELNRGILNYHVSYIFNKQFSIQIRGGESQLVRDAVDDSSIVDFNNTFDHTYSSYTYIGNSSDNELQANISLNGLSIVTGGGVQLEEMNQRSYIYSKSMFGTYEMESDYDSIDPSASAINAYIQSDINGKLISEKLWRLNVLTGTRFEQHSMYGNYFTWEFTPSLKVGDNAMIFGNYSTAFNAPSLYQLYAPEKNYISKISRGNKNLQPEKSHGFEFGVKQNSGGISFGVSIFKTIVKNTIAYVYLWDGTVGIDTLGNDWMRDDYRGDTYINIGTQTNTGFDITLNAELSMKLKFAINLNIVNGKLKYSPLEIDTGNVGNNHVQVFESGQFISDDVEIERLTRRSSSANIALQYSPVKKLVFRLEGNHVGPRGDVFYDVNLGPYGALATTTVSDYSLLNFATTYHFSDNFLANFRINNFENKKYYEINGFSTTGRVFLLGLRIKF